MKEYLKYMKILTFFGQDGVNCHISKLTINYEKAKGTVYFENWSSQFHDLNIIENCCTKEESKKINL